MNANAGSRCQELFFLMVSLMLLGSGAAPAATVPLRLSVAEQDWRSRAAELPVGGRVELGGVAGEGKAFSFALERFEVFTAGARIVVHRPQGDEVLAPPVSTVWRGTVRGEEGSLVFLSLRETGEIAGLVVGGSGGVALLGPDATGAGLATYPFDPSVGKSSPPFHCEQDALPKAAPLLPAAVRVGAAAASRVGAPIGAAGTAPLTAELAIETDWEFWNLFGDSGRAATYVGDLLGAISALYQRDLQTSLKVRYLSLWAGGPATDPWEATNLCMGLAELGNFWHDERAGVPRDAVHFLSGKSMGGGLAWIGTLCATDVPQDLSCGSKVPTFLGAYGLTSEVSGTFDPHAPAVVWDIFAVAHELGHNFGSPHTHCYRNFPSADFPEPVDLCNAVVGDAACNEGVVAVPEGGGSIMSYCHQRDGGMANINLWFGRQGFYGQGSERVPQKMRAFAETVSSCLVRQKTAPADFSGDGRSDIVVYRNGSWVTLPFYPGI